MVHDRVKAFDIAFRVGIYPALKLLTPH